MARDIDEGNAMAPKTHSLRMRFTSDPQARYCIRVVFFLAFFSVIATACSSLEPYRLPENINNIAFIEDNYREWSYKGSVYVMSIDRKRIDADSRRASRIWFDKNDDSVEHSRNWIPMHAGLRKLEVTVASEHYFSFICTRLYGHGVLALQAESGAYYRLRGEVNKEERFAEVWIENAQSGETVVTATRLPTECELPS